MYRRNERRWPGLQRTLVIIQVHGICSFHLLHQENSPRIPAKIANVPVYKYTVICLSVDLLLHINIVSSLGLL